MSRVVLFPTCVIDTVAADVGVAVARVLQAAGYELNVPTDATCCGQPAWNAGYHREAAAVARQTLSALAGDDAPICVPAGSCATMMRIHWSRLFRLVDDEVAAEEAERTAARVREFSELLEEPDAPTATAEDPGSDTSTVAYHHSCHMLRELGIEDQPESLLRDAGVAVGTWEGARRCCGFGGTFAVKQPEISVAMADDKLDDLAGIDELVGCDTTCLLHLRSRAERRGIRLRVRHLAEVLADGDGP